MEMQEPGIFASLTTPRPLTASAGSGNSLRVRITVDGKQQVIDCHEFSVDSIHSLVPVIVEASL